jgi:hypothetical protein
VGEEVGEGGFGGAIESGKQNATPKRESRNRVDSGLE